ncbi:hypothetical protein CRG98_016765 [Punica granatum]|uniref:Uncharacterized protein n=1 Tax=Punica granatum TaxID=22663 RepID=A0A2I0K2N6_PUNGR|nr:hypothetical protein CRG98_016765 [Punica granatum]
MHFVALAEQLTLRPPPKIGNWRCPKNLQLELSHCFLSVLMRTKITVFSVCRKQIPKKPWVFYVIMLRDRVVAFADPVVNSSPGFTGPPFCYAFWAVPRVAVDILPWS